MKITPTYYKPIQDVLIKTSGVDTLLALEEQLSSDLKRVRDEIFWKMKGKIRELNEQLAKYRENEQNLG